jgi:hypothetical protein
MHQMFALRNSKFLNKFDWSRIKKGSVFFLCLNDYIFNDKWLNGLFFDVLFILRGQSIVNKNWWFGINHNVNSPIGESPADVFCVNFIELCLSVVKFNFCFPLQHWITHSIQIDPFSVVVGQIQTQVNYVRLINLSFTIFYNRTVHTFQLNIYLDVSLFLNHSAELLFET